MKSNTRFAGSRGRRPVSLAARAGGWLLIETLLGWGWGLHAQPVPTPIEVTVLPPADTVMVTQSVSSVFLTLSNPTPYTNLSSSLRVGTGTTLLLDDGHAPDAAAADGTFSGQFQVPAFPTNTTFLARFTTLGQDLAVTNSDGELLAEAWVTNVTVVSYLAAVRPPNDQFADAIKLPSGGVYTGNNLAATLEPAEPFHGEDPDVAASVWWVWSPANHTRVFVDTAGSSFDPVLAVYTGANLATLEPVAWSTNDVAHGLKANVVFDAKAGVTYRIAVAGYDAGGMGSIRLAVAVGGGPDTGAPLVNIMDPPSGSLLATNLVTWTGTAKDPEPNATGIRVVTLQLNDDPPVLANGTTNWNAVLDLSPGTNVVRAWAEDIAGNASSPSIVVVRYVNPLHDGFADALELLGLSGLVTARTEFASREVGEPTHAGNEGGHSVWYWFQAPATGTLLLSTRDSSFDTLLAVYGGESVTNLTLLAANDDALPGEGTSELTLSLARGQRCRIAVDGFGEQSGLVALEYTFTTRETYYSLSLSSGLGGSITPPSGLYAEGSTQVVTALPARDFRFVGWQGSLDAATNPLSLVMTQDFTLAASFRVISHTDGFESGGFSGRLPWVSSGGAPWLVQSNVVDAGQFAAQSGRVADNQVSALFLRLPLVAGAGVFRVRVSSELGWDGLEFFVDGVLQKHWTGEVSWETFTFAVPSGVVTLEWRYVKDANYSAGEDAACFDNLYLPLPDQALTAQLSIACFPGLGIQVTVQGYPGRTYAVEASPDLLSWTSVHTGMAPSGSWVWLDPLVPERPVRVYRAVLQ